MNGTKEKPTEQKDAKKPSRKRNEQTKRKILPKKCPKCVNENHLDSVWILGLSASYRNRNWNLTQPLKWISIKQICLWKREWETHTGNRCNFCAQRRHWINNTCEWNERINDLKQQMDILY